MGAEGKSKAQIAAAIGVARNTLDVWCTERPEFRDAIACARDLALAWWEDQGQAGMWQSPEGVKLNPQLWSRSMSARFPDDYSERNKLELSGSLELRKLSDEEIDEELAQLGAVATTGTLQSEIPPDGSDLV